LLAGLVAGLAIDSMEYLLDEFVLPQRWEWSPPFPR
jgi:hypothetical protein